MNFAGGKASKTRKWTGYAKRLEHVRQLRGFRNVKAFWRALIADAAYEVSYTAAVSYHLDVPPPVHYLSRVADVCSVRLEWLATGRGPVEVVPETGDIAAPFVARRTEAMRAWVHGFDLLDDRMQTVLDLAFGALVGSTLDGWEVLRMDPEALHGGESGKPFQGLEGVDWDAVGVLAAYVDNELRRAPWSVSETPLPLWRWNRLYLLQAATFVQGLPEPGTGRSLVEVLNGLEYLTPDQREEWKKDHAENFLPALREDADLAWLPKYEATYGGRHKARPVES